MDMRSLLPELLPKAIAWAETESQKIIDSGVTLSEDQLEVARQVGVQRPELIRIKIVARIPPPEDSALRQTATELGFFGPNMVGLTLGHSIYIVRGHEDNMRLIAHECRHVHQYETLGSIGGFMPVYLQQILDFGYQSAPLEADARAHENSVA